MENEKTKRLIWLKNEISKLETALQEKINYYNIIIGINNLKVEVKKNSGY